LTEDGGLRGHEDMEEIPKSQRDLSRPGLGGIFRPGLVQVRSGGNRGIVEAVEKWGYNQKEVANYLGLHYSTFSRLIKMANWKMPKNKPPIYMPPPTIYWEPQSTQKTSEAWDERYDSKL